MIEGATGAALTVSVAALLVALPTELLTTTLIACRWPRSFPSAWCSSKTLRR